MVETSVAILLLVMGLMTLLWLLSLALRDSSIVDSFWGAGFAIAAWTAAGLSAGFGPRAVLTAVLVTIWGLRLSLHIFLRNKGKGEDFRYAAWRAQYGRSWPLRSLFHVFWLQGLILWFVSFPLLSAIWSTAGWTLFDAAGVLVWLVGMVFEAGGDWQLARFKARPENRGKLLTSGLWALTRHPNYFGDAAVWWGFFLLALPAGWWTLLSPVLMTYLLLRVSGVSMLEKSMQTRPGYEEYIQNTPAFFPKWVRPGARRN